MFQPRQNGWPIGKAAVCSISEVDAIGFTYAECNVDILVTNLASLKLELETPLSNCSYSSIIGIPLFAHSSVLS